MESIENNAKIKKFIESQIRSDEKYDYKIIQERFNKALAMPENKELRDYCFILEKINKCYKSLIDNKKFEVSGWYIEKLIEFIINYRRIHLNTNKTVSEPETYNGPTKIVWHFLPKENPKKTTHVYVSPPHKNISIPKTTLNKRPQSAYRANRKKQTCFQNIHISGVPMRGNYYQEAATDEFGCVVVCDEVG